MRITPLVIFTVIAVAQAQKGTNPYSLEYLVDSSDLVVFGKVSEFQGHAIRIEIESILKGDCDKKISVDITPTEQEAKDLSEAQKLGPSVLWFLTHDGDHYRLDNVDDRSYGLTHSQRGRRIIPMSMDGYTIGFEERLFDRIKKEAELKPGRNDRSISIRTSGWYGVETFTFPLDERIEKVAQNWVMPRSGQAVKRLFGVRVLQHFQTDENGAILKGLVHDPGSIKGSTGELDFKSEAASVLRGWRISIPSAPPKDTLDVKKVGKVPIRVAVNGVEVNFPKGVSPPLLIGGRAYARVCSISEALGVKMSNYHLESSRGVQIESHPDVIDMPIDARLVWIGNGTEEVSLPARLIHYEGFFPIRWVVGKLGGSVRWNEKLRRVEIALPRKVPSTG